MHMKKIRLNFYLLLAVILVTVILVGFLGLHHLLLNANAVTSPDEYVLYDDGTNWKEGAFGGSFQVLIGPKPASKPCYHGLCEDVLSHRERKLFKSCINNTQHPRLQKLSEGPLVEETPTPCRFMNPRDEKTRNETVLLVSFPGSGSTWTRGLLQQVTGFCTGSHLCDIDLRRHGFPGEGVTGPSVLVVKTHFSYLTLLQDLKLSELSTRVIFLVRNPYDAIIAVRSQFVRSREALYWNDTHTASLLKLNYFGYNISWIKFVQRYTKKWRNTIDSWVIKNKLPLLVVKYEDILKDRTKEISRILNFLNMTIPEAHLKQKLKDDFSRFQRKEHGKFSHYTPTQKRELYQVIMSVSAMLAESKRDHLLSVKDYMDHTADN